MRLIDMKIVICARIDSDVVFCVFHMKAKLWLLWNLVEKSRFLPYLTAKMFKLNIISGKIANFSEQIPSFIIIQAGQCRKWNWNVNLWNLWLLDWWPYLSICHMILLALNMCIGYGMIPIRIFVSTRTFVDFECRRNIEKFIICYLKTTVIIGYRGIRITSTCVSQPAFNFGSIRYVDGLMDDKIWINGRLDLCKNLFDSIWPSKILGKY